MSVDQATATEWLAQADEDPEHALAWWRDTPDHEALMPCGRIFDAIRVYEEHAAAALGILGSARETRPPAWTDAADRQTYFLVPPGAAQTWSCPGTAPLGDATWVWVPAPTSPAWIWAPDGSGALHDPVALLAALRTAAEQGAGQ